MARLRVFDAAAAPTAREGVSKSAPSTNALQTFQLSVELGWSPVYAGDPIPVTVRLDDLQLQQSMAAQLASSSLGSPSATSTSLSNNWAGGVALELASLDTNGLRHIVLPAGNWADLLRPAAIDFADLGIASPVYSREWVIDQTNLELAPGSYELTVRWNGSGWPAASQPAGFTGLSLAPLVFTVLPVVTPADLATHLGRLSAAACAHGQWTLVRSLGNQALQADGASLDPERVDTRMLVAYAALQQQDYWDAQEVVSDLALLPNLEETVSQAVQLQASLAPKLILEWLAPSQPQLTIEAWPGQNVVTDYSTDLAHWSPLGTNQVLVSGENVNSSFPPRVGNRCYFRARWLP
jgi:hypothetical protein